MTGRMTATEEVVIVSPNHVRLVGNDVDVGGIGVDLENVGSFIEVRDN